MLRLAEIVLPREEYTNWFFNTKESALKSCIRVTLYRLKRLCICTCLSAIMGYMSVTAGTLFYISQFVQHEIHHLAIQNRSCRNMSSMLDTSSLEEEVKPQSISGYATVQEIKNSWTLKGTQTPIRPHILPLCNGHLKPQRSRVTFLRSYSQTPAELRLKHKSPGPKLSFFVTCSGSVEMGLL